MCISTNHVTMVSVTSFLPSKPMLPVYFWKHRSEDKTEILTLVQYKKVVESYYYGY